MKQHMKILIRILALTVFLSALFVAISLYVNKDDLKKQHLVKYVFTKKVEQYRPLVTKYAKQYEVEEHVDIILAMMMQESGGRGNDPMQSSESLCGEKGCITDPEQSIEQGVYYFSRTLEAADGNVELAVQSYNFGIGFIDYVQSKQIPYSQQLAIEFSQEMYDKAEDKSIYTCLREEAKQYNACYGDIYYARDVLEYKHQFASKN